MTMTMAHRVYENAHAAGRVGVKYSDAFNAGVLACLEGRLNGTGSLSSPYLSESREHADFESGVAEGRELSPVGEVPFGMTDGIDHGIDHD